MTAIKPKGLIQIYTGEGKGKTTAAMGLAVRAAGSGLRVVIFHFLKGASCGERGLSKYKSLIKTERCGRGPFIKGRPTKKDLKCARSGFGKACEAVYSGKYDLVILDEINIALDIGLIDISDVIEMIESKPESVELVMTGRNCPKSLYKCADLVTEMRCIKHPFDRGIPARKGIEY